MEYQSVTDRLCTWETLERAPSGHYLALNIAYIKGIGHITCKVSLGTIPHKINDPEATTNYRPFSSLLTPEGAEITERGVICSLECQALDQGCKKLNEISTQAGKPLNISSDNFFLLLNGKILFTPEHPLKFG
ncbi:hypothetical protein EXS73_00125 [Candidatus Pacearchaeota archaeon]|nr:hypothetical protein [Candidatus Pacearchaeota archaeon]